MTFKDIIGHERPIRILKTAIQRRRLAHAYLFHGQEGIGKRLVAKAFAKAANCECLYVGARAATQDTGPPMPPHPGQSPAEPDAWPSATRGAGEQLAEEACGQCPSCRNIEAETHPDLIMVGPEGTGIKIGQIRELQEKMHLRPMAGQYRFVILNKAETMNDEAANALLKSLEEPPDQTILVLITHQHHGMLATVVSRCQSIRFNPLADHQVMGLLQKKYPDSPSQLRRIAALAMGRIGLALELDPKALEAEWFKFSQVISASSSRKLEGILEFAQEYAQDRETTERALQWIGLWLRDLLIIQLKSGSSLNQGTVAAKEKVGLARPEPRCMIAEPSSPESVRLAARLSVEEIMAFAGLIHWIWMGLARNLNRQLALEVLLMQIRNAIRQEP